MSQGTWQASKRPDLGDRLQFAQDGVGIELGTLFVTPFAVPHDAAEPLQLRCEGAGGSLGILTDLGHMTEHVVGHLRGCAALLLEANHDDEMLRQGPYPAFLKARVGGQHGHLSNLQSAEIAVQLDHAGLGPIVAAHLSAQNNQPHLAVQALSRALGRPPDEIQVATQTDGCPWISL
jgi:phosphoribosyl 1,2-cyclic phosphodiesterase